MSQETTIIERETPAAGYQQKMAKHTGISVVVPKRQRVGSQESDLPDDCKVAPVGNVGTGQVEGGVEVTVAPRQQGGNSPHVKGLQHELGRSLPRQGVDRRLSPRVCRFQGPFHRIAVKGRRRSRRRQLQRAKDSVELRPVRVVDQPVQVDSCQRKKRCWCRRRSNK